MWTKFIGALVAGLLSLEAGADFAKGAAAFEAGKFDVALRELEAGRKAGDVNATALLGHMHEEGHGVAKDLARAAQLYRVAADGKHARAAWRLGILHLRGTGVKQDFKEATRLLAAAGDAGVIEAQMALSRLYRRGVEIPKDEAASDRWLLKAAEGNHPGAQYVLWQRHREGIRVPKDPAKALAWLRKSAKAEYHPAMLDLGTAYVLGVDGLAKDFAEGLRWIRLAAEYGYGPAQRSLAVAYTLGEPGVLAQDLALAYAWLHVALLNDADGENRKAWTAEQESVRKKLAGAELKRAEALAREHAQKYRAVR